jgi:enoyl-CoA hydratase/carnithine racemase
MRTMYGFPKLPSMSVRAERSGPVTTLSHAQDLILAGRPLGAEEALRIGLANRVVPRGAARAAAEELAREIASFPQATMRADRSSALTARSLEEELARGVEVLEEARAGAERFAAGEGRHVFSSPPGSGPTAARGARPSARRTSAPPRGPGRGRQGGRPRYGRRGK